MSNGWNKAPTARRTRQYRGLAGLLLLALGASMILESRAAASTARVFRAGAATSIITPPLGVPLVGSYETWFGTNRVEKDATRKIVPQVLGLLAQLQNGGPPSPVVAPSLRVGRASAVNKAEDMLWATLAERDAGWSRIHAAEALSQLGHGPAVAQHLAAELQAWESSPQRIGAWRVLAAGANTPAERSRWVECIAQVVRDTAATDRLQAVESIGKLGEPVAEPTLTAVRAYVATIPAADALFPFWVLHLSGDPSGTRGLLAGLGATDPAVRRRAAFVVRRLNPLPAEMKAALTQLARIESAATVAFPYVLAAALTHEVAAERPDVSWVELERLRAVVSGPVHLEIVQTMLPRLDESAMLSWTKDLEVEDRSSRMAAAWAVLQIARSSRGQTHPEPSGSESKRVSP